MNKVSKIVKKFTHNHLPNSFHKSSEYIDDNGLLWKVVHNENIEKFSKEFECLKNWSDDKNIQRFISSRMTLDKVISMIAPEKGDKSKMFFCYDGKNFVGLAYTSTSFSEGQHGSIDYLIVNPNFRKNGYGTMMTSSLIHETNHFFSKDFNSGITASVEDENIPSKRTFEKNGFESIGSNTSSGRFYKIYYLKPRTLEMDR